MSLAVYLAIITVIIVGLALHVSLPGEFSLPVAFMLAAIITPTDAVAVKSLTANVEIPENVQEQLEHESLFNDASGLVLFGLATSTLQSGSFSLIKGVGTFLYVFFCAIIFGTIAGLLLVKLRTTLMRSHTDISAIAIPINVLTPIVVYWLAEELHLSGILAAVSAGVVHGILKERMNLTSTKLQVSSSTLWNIISDALNGVVFVFLGLSLPDVLVHMKTLPIMQIILISLACYLIMTFMRYIWARFNLVDLRSASYGQDHNKDSLLLAIGGIHGTITMAMAFSIPMMVNKGLHELRITAILIAALVILISLLVGTVAFPKLLPSKANSYTPEEFADTLSKTVAYAIRRLNVEGATADKEKSLVMDQLASQANMSLHINSKSYQQISVANVEKLLDEGQISPESEEHYLRLINHLNIMQGHNHPFRNIMMAFRGMKWRWIHRRQIRKTMYKLPKWTKEVKLIADC